MDKILTLLCIHMSMCTVYRLWCKHWPFKDTVYFSTPKLYHFFLSLSRSSSSELLWCQLNDCLLRKCVLKSRGFWLTSEAKNTNTRWQFFPLRSMEIQAATISTLTSDPPCLWPSFASASTKCICSTSFQRASFSIHSSYRLLNINLNQNKDSRFPKPIYLPSW